MTDPYKSFSYEALYNILALSENATGIYTGEELYIQSANDALLRLWGKDKSVIGKTIEQALPELEGQPFVEILKNVWRTGKTYTGKEIEAKLEVDGKLQPFYFDFKYRAILDDAGKTYCILHTTSDVSEQISNRRIIQENESSERVLNEELSAANEELYSSNEELAAMNEEISSVNEELRVSYQTAKQLNEDLLNSELRFKNMVQTTPIGLAVFNGANFIIETANKPVLDIWARSLESVVGKGLIEVFPELEDQPFAGYLRSVLETGKQIGFAEIPVNVNQPDGTIKNIYVDFSYDPIFDTDGKVSSILVSVKDISPEFNARKKIQEQQEELEAINEELLSSNEEVRLGNQELQENQEKLLALNAELKKSEDNLRLTVEAANLGIWNLEIGKDDVYVNQRCRDIFGFGPADNVTVNSLLKFIDPEYLPLVNKALADAAEKDLPCDIQFSIFTQHKTAPTWLRAVGRTFYDDKQVKWFYGAIQDITEQKQDEQRKNDFIGMVSHELKTPLTSLNAYLQMLQLRAGSSGDEKTLTALNKSVKQIKKMTTMINGFLNVSRLESGKIYIDKQPFDMAALLYEVEEETTATIGSHNIVFEKVEPISVLADRDKIGQVMNNFISNAVKYSPLGSNIHIACINSNGYALMSVTDKGMGIDPKDQERLFERYYRVEGKHMTTISGFGIGLYLCAEIIHRHNGHIGVESTLGKGSKFWFSIPLS